MTVASCTFEYNQVQYYTMSLSAFPCPYETDVSYQYTKGSQYCNIITHPLMVTGVALFIKNI